VNHNPYAPPQSSVDAAADKVLDPAALPGPEFLYSPRQIALAAFLGSPMASAWLTASNFRALAQPLKASRTILVGIAATIVVLCIAFVLPDNAPNLALPIAVSFAVKVIAEGRFGAIVKNHVRAGGSLRSWWRVVGIGLLFALIILAIAAVGIYLLIILGVLPE